MREPARLIYFLCLFAKRLQPGRDAWILRLVERKRILGSLVPESTTVLCSSPTEARGVDPFEAVWGNELGGIVATRRDGL